MAAPVFKAVGSIASGSGTGTLTVTGPSAAVNDVAIAIVASTGGNPTTPSGWTLAASSSSSASPFLNVYWQRVAAAGTPTCVVSGSIGARFAVIATYGGCVTSGTPTEAAAGQYNSTASTTCAIPTITTLGADRLVLLCAVAASGTVSGFSNTTLASFATEVSASLGLANGSLASAGSSGASSASLASSAASSGIALALIPVPPNTASARSTLALSTAALATATLAAVASCGLSLSAGGTATQANTASGASALDVLASGQAQGSQAAQANSVLVVSVDASLAAANQAAITSTLSLSTALTVTTQTGYLPDGRYYVQLSPRPFYASLNLRTFYAALPTRAFYLSSDPNMTPTFDTMDPRETVVLTFDASNDLASGETLTSITATDITLSRGTPGSANVDITGQAINTQPLTFAINGQTLTVATGKAVQAIASAGITGCTYEIAITCATSNPDKVLTLKGYLPVSAS